MPDFYLIVYFRFYQAESFNVKEKHECVEYYNNGDRKHASRYNNEEDCTENDGEWLAFSNFLEKAPRKSTVLRLTPIVPYAAKLCWY